MAQPVLEKISLPLETKSARCPAFPVPNAYFQIRFRQTSKNKMNMVRHDTGGMNPPNAVPYSMPDRISKPESRFLHGRWLQLAILGTTSNEKHGLVDIDPERKIVGQGFATGIHQKNIRRNTSGEKLKMNPKRESFLPETATSSPEVWVRCGEPTLPFIHDGCCRTPRNGTLRLNPEAPLCLRNKGTHRNVKFMSSLAEIEMAAEKLPAQDQRELFKFLLGKLRSGGPPLPTPRIFTSQEMQAWMVEDEKDMRELSQGS